MTLPYDVQRCKGESPDAPCPKRDNCQRDTETEHGPRTGWSMWSCESDAFERFIPVEVKGMTQLFMAVFGLTSIYCAMGNNARLRKWAPLIGLAGQPFWAWFAWQSQAWGLAVLVAAYTLVYILGARAQWGVSC